MYSQRQKLPSLISALTKLSQKKKRKKKTQKYLRHISNALVAHDHPFQYHAIISEL